MMSDFNSIDLLWISPAIALFLASLLPITLKVIHGNREPNRFITLFYAFMGLASAGVLAGFAKNIDRTAFSEALIFDGISYWITLVIVFITSFTLIFSRENHATCKHQFAEYTFLVLNSAIGMMVLTWANDLIVTFIGIELMSLCLYLIIAMSAEEKLSKEAAFKYFILGSFASAIFLYGVAFIYGTTSSTYLHDLVTSGPNLISTNRLFLFGVTMVVLGFCFKVAVFPFHAWAPDVYHGSPTPVTALMATGVKAATFIAFLRFVTTGVLNGDRAEILVSVLEWLAVLTILVGNIAAIMQSNLKRMLAYSSVAHSGYVMIGLIASGVSGASILGSSSVIFYVFAYTVMTLGSFGIVSLMEKNENFEMTTDQLKGLGKKHPWTALCMTLFMLSLAGIPPTVGFFGKFFIFSAAIKQGFFWLAIWGVIGSVISVVYYLRPVIYMYMSDEEGGPVYESRQTSHFAVGVLTVLVIALGLLANPFYVFIVKSAEQLF